MSSFRETLKKVRVVTTYGCFEFASFDLAKERFPELDKYKNTNKFTWAMNDGDALRFESWPVYKSMAN